MEAGTALDRGTNAEPGWLRFFQILTRWGQHCFILRAVQCHWATGRPALMIEYLYSQTPVWQHTGFDELTRKTSFSKLADIKYTWSLPSPFSWQSWWGPQELGLAGQRKAHKQREFFCLCALVKFPSKRETERTQKNCRYFNKWWHNYDQKEEI